MLQDISSHATDAILQGFAPTTLELAPSELPPELLYQRFAVIAAFLNDPTFDGALARVLNQPYRSWELMTERRRAGAAFPSGSAFRRALAVAWSASGLDGVNASPAASLPSYLDREQHEESLDNAPNRFVKFVLDRWLSTALELLSALGPTSDDAEPGPVRRGRQVAAEIVARLDEALGHPMFRQVEALTSVPLNNQVLLRREGYREILRTFAMTESGAALAFDRPDLTDLFAASQRNVATLYEFWCFLALADALGRVCGESKTSSAFRLANNGLVDGAPSRGEVGHLVDGHPWWSQHARRSLLQSNVRRWPPWFSRRRVVESGNAPGLLRANRPSYADPATSASRRLGGVAALRRKISSRQLGRATVDQYRRQVPLTSRLRCYANRSGTTCSRCTHTETRFIGLRARTCCFLVTPINNFGSTKSCFRAWGRSRCALPSSAKWRAPASLSASLVRSWITSASKPHNMSVNASGRRLSSRPDRTGEASKGSVAFLQQPPADTEVLIGYMRSAEHRRWIERAAPTTCERAIAAGRSKLVDANWELSSSSCMSRCRRLGLTRSHQSQDGVR